METTTVKLYSLRYDDIRTYGIGLLLIAGNILFPQLCHLFPQGGWILLPIYFFTLVGAYKFGWKVGLLTAVLSPVVNSLIFRMPAYGVLPSVMLKSILLALAAGYAASRFKKVSIPILLAIVLFYQIIGTGAEWLASGTFFTAIQDFRLGLPGMLLQIFGGYLFIKYIIRRKNG